MLNASLSTFFDRDEALVKDLGKYDALDCERSLMDSETFIYQFEVLEQHLDTIGHVNNAVYLIFYEAARWEMITKNGFGLNETIETGFGPIILEAHIRFRRELKLRQKITLSTRVTSYQKMIGTLKQEMRNEASEICSTAEFRFGLFDKAQRKLVRPTDQWLKAIGVFKK